MTARGERKWKQNCESQNGKGTLENGPKIFPSPLVVNENELAKLTVWQPKLTPGFLMSMMEQEGWECWYFSQPISIWGFWKVKTASALMDQNG
jgi:hypothetical protein